MGFQITLLFWETATLLSHGRGYLGSVHIADYDRVQFPRGYVPTQPVGFPCRNDGLQVNLLTIEYESEKTWGAPGPGTTLSGRAVDKPPILKLAIYLHSR